MMGDNSPEQNLWTAVLVTWFFDLEKLGKRTKNPWVLKEMELFFKQVNSEWTEHICHMAGVGPEFFRDRFKEHATKYGF